MDREEKIHIINECREQIQDLWNVAKTAPTAGARATARSWAAEYATIMTAMLADL